jgi:hypothetical protein
MSIPPLRAGLDARIAWVKRWRSGASASVGAACPNCYRTSWVVCWGYTREGGCICEPPDTVTMPEVLHAHDLQGIAFSGGGGASVG